jgi:lipopolysaccharide biosynthesis regulator YciM
MEPKTRVPLDFQTDGTAWFTMTLVQDPEGRFFIESAGSNGEDRFPLGEAKRRIRPSVWVKAMQEAARLREQSGQTPHISDADLVCSLFELLQSADQSAQDWAIAVFSSLQSAALPKLIEAIGADDQSLASVASRALISLAERDDWAGQAVPLLTETYCQKPHVDESIMRLLLRLRKEDGLLKAVTELANQGYERGRLTAEARGIVVDRPTYDSLVPLLWQGLSSSDKAIREGALLALHETSKKGSAVARRIVRELLRTEADPFIRSRTANLRRALCRVRCRECQAQAPEDTFTCPRCGAADFLPIENE